MLLGSNLIFCLSHVLLKGNVYFCKQVTGLSPNVRYSLVVRASTSAGLGNASGVVEVFIPTRENPRSSTIPSIPPKPESKDQFLGNVKTTFFSDC